MKNLLEGASGNNSILRSVVSMARPRDKHHDRFVATSSNPLHRGDRRNGNRLAGGTGRRRRGTSRPSQRRPRPRPLRWIARWAFRSGIISDITATIVSTLRGRRGGFHGHHGGRRFGLDQRGLSLGLGRGHFSGHHRSRSYPPVSGHLDVHASDTHAVGGNRFFEHPDDVPRRPIAPRSASRSRP